ncbi:MAG: T9SS type A sorting domain-containing protein [Saprospiraceae bacterium]|nr:T9SS type A sorting domain-containing protein [Saprospiraceae bacterium]
MNQFKFTLLFCFLPLFSFAQINSIADGNWLNPNIWDCTCVPNSSDTVIVSNQVSLNISFEFDNDGRLAIDSAASLIQASSQALSIDNASFENRGTLTVDSIYMNGNAINKGELTAKQFNNQSSFENYGRLLSSDSLRAGGLFYNYAGAYLETADMEVTGILNTYDTLLFSNFLSETGTVSNYAYMGGDNFTSYNLCINDNVGRINLTNDFVNGQNTTGGVAVLFTNNGVITVGNDWTNTKMLDGTGSFGVQGQSSNSGSMDGTFDFCDYSSINGGNVDQNTGTIGNDITFCKSTIVEELESQVLLYHLYPNPFQEQIWIEGEFEEIPNFELYNLLGQPQVLDYNVNSSIYELNTQDLEQGVYFLIIQTKNQRYTQQLIKQ